jgi:hypothetical protein
VPDAETQFGRALREVDIELIRANSPQAKGRIERHFGTPQDRWVKELRLARATTCVEANEVFTRLLPAHNRRFAKPAKDSRDAHRELGQAFNLAAILSIQEQRVVSNDYVIRYHNRLFQLLKSVYPGLRKGKVIVEQRLDGNLAIRFGEHYLKYQELPEGGGLGGSAPKPPEFNASTADASDGATRLGILTLWKEQPGRLSNLRLPLAENLRPKVFSTQSYTWAADRKRPIATSCLSWPSCAWE